MFNIDNWKWNIWETDPKTGKMKRWLGSITDPRTAFAWLKSQGKDASKYRVNNVPPSTSLMRGPGREVYATSATDIHVGDALPKRIVPGKYDDFDPRPKRATAPKTGKGTTVRHAAKPKDTKEMKKIKADAQHIIDQHKADEAAELEAGEQ